MRGFFLAALLFSAHSFGSQEISEQGCQAFFLKKPSVTAPSQENLSERADIVLRRGKVGLTKSQLIQAFRFIERKTRKEQDVYTSKETKLPCIIERSKMLRGYIIRKIRGKNALIGQGYHKVVTKAILYGPRPKVIAECLSDDSARIEIVVLKKLHSAEGTVPFLGAQKRGKKYSIYLEYFKQGSLLGRFNHSVSFNQSQIMKIASDLAKGLRALHVRKFVHRDLHAGNVLIHTKKKSCKAVLMDFGKTLSVPKAKNSIPQATRSKNPPEALIVPFSKLDRYRIDVYALGCLFYQMTWEKNVSWGGLYNIYSFDDYSTRFKRKIYNKIVSLYKTAKEQKIGTILQKQKEGLPLTQFEKFQLLIFRMISFNPKERPCIKEIVAFMHRELKLDDVFPEEDLPECL